MLDIVVYGNDDGLNLKSIKSFLLNYDIDYHIHFYRDYSFEFDRFIRFTEGNKIYFLNEEVNGVSGFKIAAKIRKYDWNSIIIILTRDGNNVSEIFNRKLMILDMIVSNNNYMDRVIADIKLAISIIYDNKLLTFKYNNVIYRIPYNQICYIEKESTVKRCIIHTVENVYYINSSIKSLLSCLTGNFCKTHQSCIVNLNNIRSIDFSSNLIIFNNDDMINMLTDKMKKVIKDCIDVFE